MVILPTGLLTGWWYTYPSEKYESNGMMRFPIWWENRIKNVPNHQPLLISPFYHLEISRQLFCSTTNRLAAGPRRSDSHLLLVFTQFHHGLAVIIWFVPPPSATWFLPRDGPVSITPGWKNWALVPWNLNPVPASQTNCEPYQIPGCSRKTSQDRLFRGCIIRLLTKLESVRCEFSTITL